MARPEKPVTVMTMPDSDSITCVRKTSTESCRSTMSYARSTSPRDQLEDPLGLAARGGSAIL